MFVLLGWISLVFLIATTLSAQQPTFKSGVDLVTVDAVVVGRDGNPADNLGPDDFTLKIDGRVRRVISAQFVGSNRTSDPARTLAASHFTSNEDINAGRLVIVAVDQAHIRRVEGRAALRAGADFIATLDAADRVGVTGLGQIGALEITRDHRAAERKLERLVGMTDPVFLHFNVGLSEALQIADGNRTRLADAVLRECGQSLANYTSPARIAEENGASRDACPQQLEQEARAVAQHARSLAKISLSALESLVASLKNFDGPKTLLFISEGLVSDPRLNDFSELAALAHDARVAIYVLQLETPTFEAAQERISPTFLQDIQMRGDGLARLAGAARGALFRLNGSDSRPFERILREISGYYLLAFEPTDADRDGRPHRIDVSLARGGGDLRARQAFRLPRGTPSIPPGDRMVALLRSTKIATDVPVRVATYSYAEPNSANLRVVVSAEAGSTSGGAASSAMLGFVLIDSRGVIAASGARDTDTARYAFSAVVPQGSYSLRVAALDSTGRSGSVQRPFDARVVQGGVLRVSDLILAETPERDDAPLDPIIDRVSASMLTAYLEVYAADETALRSTTVRFDIAREGTAAATITAPATVTVRAGGWAIARAELPVGTLAPGRYIARAEVTTSGAPALRVSRPFAAVR
jgi:VWFA-related protein